jgi:hypothetical protein
MMYLVIKFQDYFIFIIQKVAYGVGNPTHMKNLVVNVSNIMLFVLTYHFYSFI